MTGKPKISTSHRQVLPDIVLWPTSFLTDWKLLLRLLR